MKKTVVITGGSRGIGRATAELFAKQGDRVAIIYRYSEEAAVAFQHELAREGINLIIEQCDVSKKDEVNQAFERIRKQLGPIDVLVNNAGVAEQKLFSDITEADWDYIMNNNVKGMFLCSQEVLKDMISKKDGRIINISSIWGITGASCEVHYSTSKAAMIGFTKALAKEVGLSNITVNCVAPGVIATEMNQQIDEETMEELKECTALNRIGKGIDIARTVLFLAGEGGDFITGQVISPNGGFVI